MPSYSLLFMVVKAYLNTSIERTTTYARHAVGNGDGGKTSAIIESLIANTRHATRNSYRGQTCAV